MDEALEDEPPLAGGLQERLGIWLDLRHLGRAGGESEETRFVMDALAELDMSALRAHALQMPISDAQLSAMCQTAMALGVDSLRAPMAAIKLAKIMAALRGNDEVEDEDLGRAARLVITPRATRLPPPPEQSQQEPPPPEQRTQLQAHSHSFFSMAQPKHLSSPAGPSAISSMQFLWKGMVGTLAGAA